MPVEQLLPSKVSMCRAHITCLQTKERMYFQKFPAHMTHTLTFLWRNCAQRGCRNTRAPLTRQKDHKPGKMFLGVCVEMTVNKSETEEVVGNPTWTFLCWISNLRSPKTRWMSLPWSGKDRTVHPRAAASAPAAHPALELADTSGSSAWLSISFYLASKFSSGWLRCPVKLH